MADRTVLIRYIVDVGQAVGATRQFENAQRRLGVNSGKSMRAAGQQVSTLAKVASFAGPAIAVGVGGALAVSAKAAIDFETSFAGVRKTLDASEGQFQRLAGDMRDLAKEIPVSVNELNKIAEIGGQLGIEAQNITTFTRTIAEIGVATPLAADQAALSISRLANILGVAQSEIFRIGSSLVELGNNFATTEDQILNFSLRIAPIGKTVGLTADQVLALSAAFSSVGVPAERGGTAVQRTFITMEEAVLGGGEALQEFADIAGMTSEQFAEAYEQNAAMAFQAFIEGLAQAQEEGRNVIQMLRDVGLSNQRAFTSLLAAAGGFEQLADALGQSADAWDDGSAATEEARKRFETTEGQIQLAKNAINDAAIALGDAFLPAIKNAAGGVADFVNSREFSIFMESLTWIVEQGSVAADVLSMMGRELKNFTLLGLERAGALLQTQPDAATSVFGSQIEKGSAAMREMSRQGVELQKVMDALRTGVLASGDAFDRGEKAMRYLADTSALTEEAIESVQRQLLLSDQQVLDIIDNLVRLGVVTKDDNTKAWMLLNKELARARAEVARQNAANMWAALAGNLEEVAKMAEEAGISIRDLADAELEARGQATSFIQSLQQVKDAQMALNKESNVDNLLDYVDAWNGMREASLDLVDGIEPVIRSLQEMADAGAITEDQLQDGIRQVLQYQQAALEAAGATEAWATSAEILNKIAAATGGTLQSTILAIYGVNNALLEGARGAVLFAQAMQLAGDAASYAFVTSGAFSQQEMSAIFELSTAIRRQMEGFGGGVWESILDGIQGSASSSGGEVAKTFKELAVEASRKFIDGVRLTLSRSAMERALAGAKQAVSDALEELDDLPARIRETMRALRDAQREAQRITDEEQAGLLRGELDILRGEKELADLRREQMEIPQRMADLQKELTEAQEAYNEALLEAERLEHAHKAALTDKQADLFRVQRAYALGQASFQDVIDAELRLAEELAKSGDAAEMKEEAEEDLVEAQKRIAQELEDLRYRQKEIALELQLAELELRIARKELTKAMQEAIGPTQKVKDLEEELVELRERQAELRKQFPELEEAVLSAELDLIAAHLDLIEAGNALLAMEDQYKAFFQAIIDGAGLAAGALAGMMSGGGGGGGAGSQPNEAPSSPPGYVKDGDGYRSIYSGEKYTEDDLRRLGVIAHQGAFINAPASSEFPVLARGQEVIMPIDNIAQAISRGVAAAMREAAGSGDQTIVVQLGDREVARWVADDVMQYSARLMRRARRVS